MLRTMTTLPWCLLRLSIATLLLLPSLCTVSAGNATRGSLGVTYQVALSKAASPYQVDFTVPTEQLTDGAFRATVTSAAIATAPVMVTLQHRESIETWTVAANATVARTLCPPISLRPKQDRGNATAKMRISGSSSADGLETVTLTLITQSAGPVAVDFAGHLVSNFTLTMGSRVTFGIDSPDSPLVFALRLPSAGDEALLGFQALAPTERELADSCARLSLRRHVCPLHEQRGLVSSQTVISRGHLLVRAQPMDLMQFVTVQLLADASECGGGGSGGARTKNFSLSVEPVMPLRAILPVSISVLCFALLFVLVPVCAYVCWREGFEEAKPTTTAPGAEEAPAANRVEMRPLEVSGDGVATSSSSGTCNCSALPEGVVSLKQLCSQSSVKNLERQQTRYCFHVAVVAVFYSLPAVQLVLSSQSWLHESGDQDRCYYNFACLRPLSLWGYTVYASNSVVSNLGYVIIGAAFLVCVTVHRYAWRHLKQMQLGVPPSHGLHYAAGFGMVTEGLLSAGYHMCPSASSFQFDTAFMLLLAGLLAMLVMAKRRPGLRPPPHLGCLAFAALILLNTLGSSAPVRGSPVRSCVFAATGVMLLLGARFIYLETVYEGRWRQSQAGWRISLMKFVTPRALRRGRSQFRRECLGGANVTFQLFLSCLCLVEAAISFAAAFKPSVVSSYSMFLLGSLISNTIVYLVYYLIRKLQSKGHHRCPVHRGLDRTALAASSVLLLIAMVMWCLAVMLFMRAPTDWKLSPAESREKNSNCLALDYFDVHDLWHFASALALFLSFLFLLIIDNDVAGVPREFLEVF